MHAEPSPTPSPPDLSERPAVPPMDTGGDERIGLYVAGAILIALGLGLGVVGNLAVHLASSPAGMAVGPWTVFPNFGPYAWAVFLLGLVTGVVGIAFLFIAREYPKAPAVLPGAAY